MTSLSTVLRASWKLVDDRQDRVAEHFYARLFLSDPQLLWQKRSLHALSRYASDLVVIQVS